MNLWILFLVNYLKFTKDSIFTLVLKIFITFNLLYWFIHFSRVSILIQYDDENLKYMATMSILITILIQSYNVSCNNNKTVINLLHKILIGHVTWKMCTV